MLCWRDTRTESQTRLLKSKEAPEYMREIAITSGYRPKLSYKSCVVSCFLLHNETINIWSHFVGFAIFLYCLAITIIYPPPGYTSIWNLLPVIMQLISYQICMISSALFHTFSCHSEEAHRLWMETDHFGIVVALFGTYISTICNIFHCEDDLKIFHLGIVVALFTMISGATFAPSVVKQIPFVKREKGGIPLALFLFLAGYVVVPCAHWIWLKGGIANPTVLVIA